MPALLLVVMCALLSPGRAQSRSAGQAKRAVHAIALQSDQMAPKVTVRLDRQTVEAALRRVFESAGQPYRLDAKDVRGQVSSNLVNVPLPTALRLILSMADPPLAFHRDGEVYVITPRSGAAASAGPGPAPVAVRKLTGNETDLSLEEIDAALRASPSDRGPTPQRCAALLSMDRYIESHYGSVHTDPPLIALYERRMRQMAEELKQPVVRGARIWTLFSSSVIVKTPTAVFAHDLLNGYNGWHHPSSWKYRIPDEVLRQIQLETVSHDHGDHRDTDVIDRIKGFGGAVLGPSEEKWPSVPMPATGRVRIGNLVVDSYPGRHSVPHRIFRVSTPEGLTLIHLGDNEGPHTTPRGQLADVLFVSGQRSVDQMRAHIDEIRPSLVIPHHIQEVGHMLTENRGEYRRSLEAVRSPSRSRAILQFWGEHFDYLPALQLEAQPPEAAVWRPYRARLRVLGGRPPYQFALVLGRLPTGISLTADGWLQGTPTEAAASVVNVRVTDPSGGNGTLISIRLNVRA